MRDCLDADDKEQKAAVFFLEADIELYRAGNSAFVVADGVNTMRFDYDFLLCRGGKERDLQHGAYSGFPGVYSYDAAYGGMVSLGVSTARGRRQR